MTLRAQAMKGKNKLDFIKIKTFCASKGTIMKVKRQHKEREKIFANHVSDKGLVCRIYKEHLQLSNERQIIQK